MSSSKYLERAAEALSSLPGIGKKTAMRLALNLLNRTPREVEQFTGSINDMKQHIRFCVRCHNLSDAELCSVCAHPKREQEVVCVVEDVRDLMAIESTHQYFGLYHVLGGSISPMDGIGPSDLNIESLITRVGEESIQEVILALSTTLEGDTTAYYLFKKLNDLPVKVSTIARGVSVGDELQYTDEITLGKSIQHRVPYESSIPNQD